MAKPSNAGTIGQEVGRKLSIKELGWDKASILQTVLAAQNDKHFLGRFVGTVTGLKPYRKQDVKDGESPVGYGLQGDFEGISGKTGETVKGIVCYLPGYINDAITSIFAADAAVESVKIAYDVYAYYDDSAATSYVFSVHDLLNVGSESVAEVKEAIKALPLPSGSVPLALPKE